MYNRMFFIARNSVKKAMGCRCSSLYSAKNVLSEENMRRTISKFANMTSIRLQPHQPAKKAAVLIPICIVDDQVSLLYTIRAPHLKSHRGQVSFPGGMQDISDDSLEDTALRETREELGIHEDDVELWGSGNLIVTRGETCVLPVIGCLRRKLQLSSLKLNRSEVHDVFAVSIQDLCNPSNIGYTQFRGAYSAPVYNSGKRRIWGLTAIITNIFLKSFLSAKAYSHPIKYVPTVQMNKPILPTS